MRIILEGKINRLYVQTLCMMFFRGEKFSENEENPRGILKVVTEDTESGIVCNAYLSYGDKSAKGSSFEMFSKDDKYERTSKIAVGKAVYSAGVELTGREVPWGILTGIRPSKIASELLDNMQDDYAIKELQTKYLLSSEKARLAVEVAKNEAQIFKKADQNTCSMYISIPFCPTRCSYCSFISYASPKLFELIPSYIDKLVLDIKLAFLRINRLKLKLISIYIGGGTPTTLNVSQLDRILSVIDENLNKAELLEYTVECGRPDTVTKEKLLLLKKYGVGRISINPQTLNDDVLKTIGRHHTVEDFFKAFKIAKESGIEIINTDLIAGLDNDSFDSFKKTVDDIIKLAPQNITVHSFSVKKSAQILSDDKGVYEREGEEALHSVQYSYDTLTANGYVPYYMYRQKNTIADLENVGYAKKDTFGIYNVLMMADGHTVFGIGAGATTKLVKKNGGNISIHRIFSPKYPYEYLQDNQDIEKDIFDFFKEEVE